MADWCLSLGTAVSSTNKTDRHDITEIVLKVTFNTITLTPLTIRKVGVFLKYHSVIVCKEITISHKNLIKEKKITTRGSQEPVSFTWL